MEKEARKEWFDNNVTMPKMMEENKEKAEAHALENKINRKLATTPHEHTFEAAVLLALEAEDAYYRAQGYIWSEKTHKWWCIENVG